MKVDIVIENVPNLLQEILDQLERVNESPPIHRYIQLHNSFELVIRYLAVTSYLWVKTLGTNPELILSFEHKLKQPSLDGWKHIFLECAACLKKINKISKGPKDSIDSNDVIKVLEHLSQFVGEGLVGKKAKSTTLLEAMRKYRNLTRGHGCIIYDGYEDFIQALESALCDFILFWKDLLNILSKVEGNAVYLKIADQLVDASIFLSVNDNGRIIFYNSVEGTGENKQWYFLNYDNGLHQLVPKQEKLLEKEFRIPPKWQSQLELFPKTKEDIENEYGANVIRTIKKHLSYEYDKEEVMHSFHESEIRLLASLRRFADNVDRQDAFKYLLSKLGEYAPADSHDFDPQDVYFDFASDQWLSLSERDGEAVEKYRRDLEVLEIAEMLADLVKEQKEDIAEDEEVLASLDELLEGVQENLDALKKTWED